MSKKFVVKIRERMTCAQYLLSQGIDIDHVGKILKEVKVNNKFGVVMAVREATGFNAKDCFIIANKVILLYGV